MNNTLPLFDLRKEQVCEGETRSRLKYRIWIRLARYQKSGILQSILTEHHDAITLFGGSTLNYLVVRRKK